MFCIYIHALKSLHLYDQIKGKKMDNNQGCRQTALQTRKMVWHFWHEHSQESSDTTRPAKLCKENRNKIQSGLVFPASVKVIKQRGIDFF